MKKVAIVQSNYIPWKGYFDLIAAADVFVIYDEVQYTKNDWRNRNLIKTPNGLQWITIPVRIMSLHQLIYESKISSSNWQKKHISTITHNYARAKYFKHFKEQIFSFYENQSNIISDVNVSLIKSIFKMLGITTTILDSRDLDLRGDKNQKLVDACKKLSASTYISGPAAKSYLDTDLFFNENIAIKWMDYSEYPKYKQLYEPFEHGVTILDLLFNTGEDAKLYMKYLI